MLLDTSDHYTKLLDEENEMSVSESTNKEHEMNVSKSNGVHKHKRVWPIWLVFATLALAFNLRGYYRSSEIAPPIDVLAIVYCFFFYAGILILPTKRPRFAALGLCPLFFLASISHFCTCLQMHRAVILRIFRQHFLLPPCLLLQCIAEL